ncbi:DNA helicase [Bacillus ndiopicus]|uniref:DNA helicase n=1 Tax=Bacillus ndiopicus TaxID=1347368 RepID=UPI000A4C944B|nr:DNA helicase [Bacillus ndiopicus]
MRTQQEVNSYIEELMFLLTQKADAAQFENTIQQNIATKKESATDEQDFFDRLMLNITYYVENKAAWVKILRDTYGQGQVPTVSYIESESLAQQMRIRQFVSEKMDDYTKMFHSQYKALNVTEEAVVYDYAYASVEHSLRFDFLTYLTIQPQANVLLDGDFEETLRVIEGYVAYYTDQFVNRMELME